jgi:hypothetical protein
LYVTGLGMKEINLKMYYSSSPNLVRLLFSSITRLWNLF